MSVRLLDASEVLSERLLARPLDDCAYRDVCHQRDHTVEIIELLPVPEGVPPRGLMWVRCS